MGIPVWCMWERKEAFVETVFVLGVEPGAGGKETVNYDTVNGPKTLCLDEFEVIYRPLGRPKTPTLWERLA